MDGEANSEPLLANMGSLFRFAIHAWSACTAGRPIDPDPCSFVPFVKGRFLVPFVATP
jgi:hypothetical protein